MNPKIVIVGGVAAGASAAAKARRVNERAEIILFEKGPYVSFANCGLPYYVGGEIKDRSALFLQTPESFKKRFNVQVKVLHQVTRIDRAGKKVEVKDLSTGNAFFEPYDKLILAPGAGAIVPDLPGIHASNIFVVKTVPDSDAIRAFLDGHPCKKAVVIGAGFIGLEAVEALKHRGLEVTVIEMLPQVLPPFDADMAFFVSQHLTAEGIDLILSDGVKAFHGGDPAKEVECNSGRKVSFDLAILSIGVRPELKLAQDAGIRIGPSGGIDVNEFQQTSDPDIYAAGDATETVQPVLKAKTRIPLAGPANKQGRVAGANAAGDPIAFPGSFGTAIVETLGIVAAKTGLSEKEARKAGLDAYTSFTHSLDHAGYFPGSSLLHIKLVAENGSGRLLGAQVVGEGGVDKRIDVLATALSAGLAVTDLENLDLAYAPQFSSAKDPVNIAGFVASNVLRKDFQTVTCEELKAQLNRKEPLQVVDVRTRAEYESGHLDQAYHIPIDELRERFHELDPGRKTVVYCKVGLRGYIAVRILQQSGFNEVYNLTGGMLSCPKRSETLSMPRNGNETVGVPALRELIGRESSVTVDVREANEYLYEHIDGTLNFPQSLLGGMLDQLPRDKEIYVLCATGARSAQSLITLKAGGFVNAHCVEGGLAAWKRLGYPVIRRKGPIPIMRQVQIISGSLALIGGLVIPLRWIAVIIGCGLIIAGATGTCGMARLLSKLPWNRVDRSSGSKPPCKPTCA